MQQGQHSCHAGHLVSQDWSFYVSQLGDSMQMNKMNASFRAFTRPSACFASFMQLVEWPKIHCSLPMFLSVLILLLPQLQNLAILELHLHKLEVTTHPGRDRLP